MVIRFIWQNPHRPTLQPGDFFPLSDGSVTYHCTLAEIAAAVGAGGAGLPAGGDVGEFLRVGITGPEWFNLLSNDFNQWTGRQVYVNLQDGPALYVVQSNINNANNEAVVIQGAVGQTANILTILNGSNNAVMTSIGPTGDVTAPYFIGDGSKLTNLPLGAVTLDDLTDVVIATPADGQVLTYDGLASKWVNADPAGGGSGKLQTNNTYWVDSEYGDNNSALPDRADLPYRALGPADALAQLGELVHVRPGSYTTSAPLSANGAAYRFDPETTVTSADGTPILSFSGAPVTHRFTGPVRLVNTLGLVMDQAQTGPEWYVEDATLDAQNSGGPAVVISTEQGIFRRVAFNSNTADPAVVLVTDTNGEPRVVFDQCDFGASSVVNAFALAVSGGVVEVRRMRHVCSVNSGGVKVSANANVTLVDAWISCKFSASSNPILKEGGTLTLVNCTLLAFPGFRYSIEAPTPQTVYVEGTLTVNQPLHPNVTVIGGPVIRIDEGSALFRPGTNAVVPFAIQRRTGQTADLTRWQSEVGATMSGVDKDGKFFGDGSLLTNLSINGVGEKWARRAPHYPPVVLVGNDDEFDDESFSGWTSAQDAAPVLTLVENNDVLSILHPGGDAAAEMHAWLRPQAFVANDWIEICYNVLGRNQQHVIIGVVFANGTTWGAGAQAALDFNAFDNNIACRGFANFNTNNANPGGAAIIGGRMTGNLFLRMKYLGANQWRCYTSVDGVTYHDYFGAALSVTLTPTHGGFYVSTWGGASPVSISLRYCLFGNDATPKTPLPSGVTGGLTLPLGPSMRLEFGEAEAGGEVLTVADGPTVTFDLSASNRFEVTLGGNRTFALASEMGRRSFVLFVTQDGLGSRTVTWWPGVRWQGGVTPNLTPTPGKTDVFSFTRLAGGGYLGVASLNY